MRTYYQRYDGGTGFGMRLSPAVKWLLIANVASFLLGTIVGRPYVYLFGLVPQDVLSRFLIWQPVTYLFLHGGFFHLFFNMFGLWMFGSELEWTWGTRFFLKFYFIAGIGSGLFTVFFSQTPTVPTIGASGAILAIFMAFALTYPDRYIFLYFFFPVKAKYLMLVLFLIELFASAGHVHDGIGHITHLGGMLIAYFYLRWGNLTGSFFDDLKKGRIKRRRKIRFVRPQNGSENDRMKSDVDRVLDKISREGIKSLTTEEWETLNRASKRFKSGEESD
jgi:membrane associated rhomboid family serine protease